MRKKISVRDLRPGMFVEELCGSWMDHPFWRSAFLLTDPADLKSIRECGIQDVWIDNARGLDVERAVVIASETAEQQKDESMLAAAARGDVLAASRVTFEAELSRARQIQTHAKQAVTSMFQEARMGRAIPAGEAAALVDEISGSVLRNPSALLSIVRLKNKDDYTYLHSVAVCALMVALGRQMGLEGEALRSVGGAGLLHDIGKMAIADEVLNKPGRLTDSEFDLVKTHPERGWEILQASEISDATVLDVCRHHHERVDGTGYPDRIQGEPLTLFARMGAVCDVYDAVTSDRAYKKGWEAAEAIRKMAEWKGHFDERVFQKFVKVVGIYPTGTLVRLASGRLGVVTDQNRSNLLMPMVKVFFSARHKEPIRLESLDLSQSDDRIENMEDTAQWGFDLKKIIEL
jgi:putative nucleotidyltransferase with HDIG domain